MYPVYAKFDYLGVNWTSYCIDMKHLQASEVLSIFFSAILYVPSTTVWGQNFEWKGVFGTKEQYLGSTSKHWFIKKIHSIKKTTKALHLIRKCCSHEFTHSNPQSMKLGTKRSFCVTRIYYFFLNWFQWLLYFRKCFFNRSKIRGIGQ